MAKSNGMTIDNPKFCHGETVLVVNSKKKTFTSKEVDSVVIKKNYAQTTTYVFKDGTEAHDLDVYKDLDDIFKAIHKGLGAEWSELKLTKKGNFDKQPLPDIAEYL